MKIKLPALMLLTLFGVLPVCAQSDDEEQPADAFELRAGRVVNGHAVSFGMAAKLYTSSRFSLTPELMLLGGPVTGMTLRCDFPVNDKVRFTPHLGAGFLPVPFVLSAIGIAGFDVSYAVDPNVRLFVDARIYGFSDRLLSRYGSGIYEVRDLQSKGPAVISAGVSF